jgi:hypothetical protein
LWISLAFHGNQEQKIGVLGTIDSGDQEQNLGVSGTGHIHMSLIFLQDLVLLKPLTLLTQINALSNAHRVPDDPMIGKNRKLKPFEGFHFPKEGLLRQPFP